jgi:uncharacterized protein (TIGR00369 family)
LTRNRSAWCFRLCAPDEEGNGRCGRLAPHSLRSRLQLSIESHNKKLFEAHCEKLEHMYLTGRHNEYYDSGVRISEGEAEIVIPVQEKFSHAAGAVHDSICYAAMADSAALAVNSIVEKSLVVTVNFSTQLTHPIAADELIAKSRFLGMSENHYLAESVLTDPEGKELGRGNGTFMEGSIPLSHDVGYC